MFPLIFFCYKTINSSEVNIYSSIGANSQPNSVNTEKQVNFVDPNLSKNVIDSMTDKSAKSVSALNPKDSAKRKAEMADNGVMDPGIEKKPRQENVVNQETVFNLDVSNQFSELEQTMDDTSDEHASPDFPPLQLSQRRKSASRERINTNTNQNKSVVTNPTNTSKSKATHKLPPIECLTSGR